MPERSSPSVTESLGDAGASPEIVLHDQVWRIGHPTQRAKSELENLAIRQATKEILDARPLVGEAAYQEMMTSHRRAMAAKEYRTFGPGWQAVITGPDGHVLFLLALLRERHPEAHEGIARELLTSRGDEVAVALMQVAPPFCELLVSEMTASAEEKAQVLAKMVEGYRRAGAAVEARLARKAPTSFLVSEPPEPSSRTSPR